MLIYLGMVIPIDILRSWFVNPHSLLCSQFSPQWMVHIYSLMPLCVYEILGARWIEQTTVSIRSRLIWVTCYERIFTFRLKSFPLQITHFRIDQWADWVVKFIITQLNEKSLHKNTSQVRDKNFCWW